MKAGKETLIIVAESANKVDKMKAVKRRGGNSELSVLRTEEWFIVTSLKSSENRRTAWLRKL